MLWYANFHIFFPQNGLKFFFVGFSDLLDYEMTNDKCLRVHESVTITKVEPLLYLNMFQSALNLVHMFIDTVPRDVCFFTFIGFFVLLGLKFLWFCGFCRVDGPFYQEIRLAKLFIFLNIALISEFVGICIGRNTLSGGAEPPTQKQIRTDFIYFKIVSFTTSDIY